MTSRIDRVAGLALAAVLILGSRGALRAQQAKAPPRSVTLEQAVQLTLEHSPLMVQAEGVVRTTSASQRTAIGSFLPSLSASSGTSLTGQGKRFNSSTNTWVDAGSSRSYTGNLSASMDVFSGGRRLSQLRQANAENAAADASLLQQRFGVALTAKTSFFDVLRTGDLVRVTEAQLTQAQQSLDAAQERMKVGSATRSDVLRAQLSVNQAKQALLQAQTNEASAQFALGRLVGEGGPVAAAAPGALEPAPLAVTEADLPALVEAQSPGVVAAQASVKSASAGIMTAKSQYFPTARLSTGTNWSNNQFSTSGGNSGWNLGLNLSLPIFNGFQREQNVETANVAADIARAELSDARLSARATLEKDLAALKLAEQQVSLSQEAVQVAEEDLRVQSERYRLGAGTMLDQLTSQSALVQARTNAVNARYDYQIARAQLEALVGRSL